ncbi:CLUMA_CG017938, isoform A [Clunio marinus]|uniref:CLUMA_CG017938, isoform A n=1 Tax=Clunio marinus TaxID=568069 RepID=A0A1J1IXL0_9DIPT|nr:CLUMA_CG017938, isoform A [Clunio marinus]
MTDNNSDSQSINFFRRTAVAFLETLKNNKESEAVACSNKIFDNFIDFTSSEEYKNNQPDHGADYTPKSGLTDEFLLDFPTNSTRSITDEDAQMFAGLFKRDKPSIKNDDLVLEVIPPFKNPSVVKQKSQSTSNSFMFKKKESFEPSQRSSNKILAQNQEPVNYSEVFSKIFRPNKPETEKSTKSEQETPKAFYPDFESARQIHVIQNRKRGIQDEDNPRNSKIPSNFNHKNEKLSDNSHTKTLGLRMSMNSQFKPPFKKKEAEKMEIDNENEAEMVDDPRLKGIEPKILDSIKREVIDTTKKVQWSDIAGLIKAKQTIQEAVVLPLLRPEIFQGLRTIPKGILLFGPPGTGKTLIGKCVATHARATFFSISASSLTSKWIGEGEKMVKALFLYARVKQPSVIFIDEIDSLLSKRSESEHESSRRMKTEFLVQLDGAHTNDKDRILLIGATNRPQELDDAARRRFTRRLYIPLPEFQARHELLVNLVSMNDNNLSDYDINEITNSTEGYSGADIKELCSEASMQPIRELSQTQILDITISKIRAMNINDFRRSLKHVKASVSMEDLQQYIDWNERFGSTA